jgi:hypothetical protein
MSASEAIEVIRARLALQSEQELADVVAIGQRAEINRELMPTFAAAYLEFALV